MSKRPKKRNKPYRGEDANPALGNTQVQHYTAVERSAFSEWWMNNKRIVKLLSIAGVFVIITGYLLVQLVLLVF